MAMQQCWYLFPGQTIESTKVEERGKALLVSQDGWKQLTSHLEKKDKQEQLVQEDLARKEYLKQGSYNMTKNWDNSIEKIRARRLEEHETKIQKQKEERMQNFMALRAEQEKERQRYLEQVKKSIFLMEEKPRNLNTALLLGEVMHERKLQNAFDAKQRERKRLNEEKYAKFVFEEAEKERQRNLEKQRKRRQDNIDNAKAVMDQIKKREEEYKNARDKEREAEIKDNQTAYEEYKALKKHQAEMEQAKKMQNREILNETRGLKEKLRNEEIKNDKAFDKINDIYARAKCRIDRLRREKVIELRENRKKYTDVVAQKIAESLKGKSEEEQRYYENGRKDIENRELERKEKEEKHKKDLIKERLDARKEYLEQRDQQKAINYELEGYIYLNRLKSDECTKQHQKELITDDRENKKNYARLLKEQMQEKELERQEEKRMEELEYQRLKQKLADLDNRFFAYGDEVYNLAKDYGRPTMPIERVIENYKIENGMKKKKKVISQLVSNVPIDSTNGSESKDNEDENPTCKCANAKETCQR